MARSLFIPASLLLLAALVLSFLVSLSLPSLPFLDIIRINNPDLGLPAGTETTEIRMGIWTACAYNNDGSHICGRKELGYELQLINLLNLNSGIIKSSWTRGLIVHTIATGFIFIAFVTSLFGSLTVNFVAFIASSFAALITLVAFAIDIAFFALVHSLIKDVNKGALISPSTKTAPGFWLSFVSLILVLLASVTFCFGQRRERRSSQSTAYPMQSSQNRKFWDKFEFNGNS